MNTLRRFTRLGAALACVALLAGCSLRGNPLMSTNDVAALRQAAPTGAGSFTQGLANEYGTYANVELTDFDYTNADYFAKKGMAAAGGQAVAPEDISRWNIPSEKRQELSGARARLVSALDGGGRDRAPALAARAQERYDCWMEQQEENWQVDDIAACRGDFLAAMNDLEAALRPAVAQAPAAAQPAPQAAQRQYNVYFDFDRAELTPDARRIVEQAVAATQGGGTARIELVGKADRAGTDAYNQRLSERRAQAVQQALLAGGVSRDRVSARGVGESQPPVPTPDGVREPRNRVVELTIR